MSSNNQKSEQIPLLKIVIIGDSGVGKTSFMWRQSTDTFSQRNLCTIGCDFMTKVYDLGLFKVRAQFWDTAGQQRFVTLHKTFYRNAKAVCLCFSLNSRKSFENLQFWVNQLIENNVSLQNLFLIGCKSDLDIQVPTDQIILYANKRNIKYFQTSSLTGQGVHQAMQNIMISSAQKQLQISAHKKMNQKDENNLQIKMNEGPRRRSCC